MSRALNIFGGLFLVLGLIAGFMFCTTVDIWYGLAFIASAVLSAVILFGFAEHLSSQKALVEAANIIAAPHQYYLDKYVDELLLPQIKAKYPLVSGFDIKRSFPQRNKQGELCVDGTVFVQTDSSYSYEPFTAQFDFSDSYLKLSDWTVVSINFEKGDKKEI